MFSNRRMARRAKRSTNCEFKTYKTVDRCAGARTAYQKTSLNANSRSWRGVRERVAGILFSDVLKFGEEGQDGKVN